MVAMKENRKVFMIQSGIFKFPPECKIGAHTDCEYIIHWEPLENAKVTFNIFVRQKITFSFGLSTSSVSVSKRLSDFDRIFAWFGKYIRLNAIIFLDE